MNIPGNNSWLGIAVILGILLATLTLVNTFNYDHGFDVVKDPRGMIVVAIVTGAGLAIQKLLAAK
jgi:hypothetical protein